MSSPFSSLISFHRLVFVTHFRQFIIFYSLIVFLSYVFAFFPLFTCFRFPSSSVSLLLFDLFVSFSCSAYPFMFFPLRFQALYLSSHCFILCLISTFSFRLLLCTVSNYFCTFVFHTSSHSSPHLLLLISPSIYWNVESSRYIKRCFFFCYLW